MWIAKFSLKFYFLFIVLSLIGDIIIRYNSLHIDTIVVYVLYVSLFLIGILIGNQIPEIHIPLFKISPKPLIYTILPISIISVILSWYYMITHYGSLDYIFAHAFGVRSETIGDGEQLVPVYLSYAKAFVFSGFAISIIMYKKLKEYRWLLFSLCFGIVAFLSDLMNFGRVGTLYIIFMIAAYVLISVKRINYKKLFIGGGLLSVILMIPKFIRSGGTLSDTQDAFSRYLKFPIPELFFPLVQIYYYYFSGLYALDELLQSFNNELSYGARAFAALINLGQRIISQGESMHRVTIIAKNAHVPFETNIYTIIGESYMDFGMLGIIVLSIFYGINLGYLFKYKGFYAESLKLALLAWLFYTPLYNVFSFGAYLLTFLFLVFLTIFSKKVIINNQSIK